MPARRASGRASSFPSATGFAVRTVSTRSCPFCLTVASSIFGGLAAPAPGAIASSAASASRAAARAGGILRMWEWSGTEVLG